MIPVALAVIGRPGLSPGLYVLVINRVLLTCTCVVSSQDRIFRAKSGLGTRLGQFDHMIRERRHT